MSMSNGMPPRCDRRNSPSEVVRDAIEDSEMSRYEIAGESGLSESTLSRFVWGQTSLTLQSLDRLAPVLGLRLVVEGKGTKRRRTK